MGSNDAVSGTAKPVPAYVGETYNIDTANGYHTISGHFNDDVNPDSAFVRQSGTKLEIVCTYNGADGRQQKRAAASASLTDPSGGYWSLSSVTAAEGRVSVFLEMLGNRGRETQSKTLTYDLRDPTGIQLVTEQTRPTGQVAPQDHAPPVAPPATPVPSTGPQIIVSPSSGSFVLKTKPTGQALPSSVAPPVAPPATPVPSTGPRIIVSPSSGGFVLKTKPTGQAAPIADAPLAAPPVPPPATKLAPAQVVQLTAANFAAEVFNQSTPVIVDISDTKSCGPCKTLEPVLAKVAQEYAGKVKICVLDKAWSDPAAAAILKRYNPEGTLPFMMYIDPKATAPMRGPNGEYGIPGAPNEEALHVAIYKIFGVPSPHAAN